MNLQSRKVCIAPRSKALQFGNVVINVPSSASNLSPAHNFLIIAMALVTVHVLNKEYLLALAWKNKGLWSQLNWATEISQSEAKSVPSDRTTF
jgi:hypothetical protein